MLLPLLSMLFMLLRLSVLLPLSMLFMLLRLRMLLLLSMLFMLLRLGMLLLSVLFMLLRLGMLLLSVLFMLLRLRMLLLSVLFMLLRLRMLRLWLGLPMLLFGLALLFALLISLCIGRGDSDQQRQNGRARDFKCSHGVTSLPFVKMCSRSARTFGRRVGRVADRFAGDDKLYSPVLLPSGRIAVGGHRQTVAETFCAH
jgi:hypothetical protein